MTSGRIIKALSGFYYVDTNEGLIECRARGKFRKEGISPLVGDIVDISIEHGKGTVELIHGRKNSFSRPSVANLDTMVVLACGVNPISDPFLIDRIIASAQNAACEVIVCINKQDLNEGRELLDIYKTTGHKVIQTSATTGHGIEELKEAIKGKLSVFTGNSGAGKSSILNFIAPELALNVGEVSDKLGRGRHTTRHVELFAMGDSTYIVDTPGFSSFDGERTEHIPKEALQYAFNEFIPFIGTCRFDDCAHLKEPSCAIRQAVEDGVISQSRYESYKRLYEISSQVKDWEKKSSSK